MKNMNSIITAMKYTGNKMGKCGTKFIRGETSLYKGFFDFDLETVRTEIRDACKLLEWESVPIRKQGNLYKVVGKNTFLVGEYSFVPGKDNTYTYTLEMNYSGKWYEGEVLKKNGKCYFISSELMSGRGIALNSRQVNSGIEILEHNKDFFRISNSYYFEEDDWKEFWQKKEKI